MPNKLSVRFFSFEKYHNKKNTGSAKIRVQNLIKYWTEADLYKYGEKADVLIFQKVYVQPDFEFPTTYPGIKILDICDPDWLEDMPIKQTVDAMDAVTVPTKALKDFIEQLTDKPVRIIKDRFDLAEFPSQLKQHTGMAKNVVWFGYSHNARTLKGAINSIKELGLNLTVISNKEPGLMNWGEAIGFDKTKYTFLPFKQDEAYYEISQHDIAILPFGGEPRDRFKSNNKDIVANLCGLPVVKNREELEEMLDPEARNKEVKVKYANAIENYDVKLSVKEMKDLINEISRSKT